MSSKQARLVTACVCIIAIAAVAAILIYTETVMVPCVLAGFVAFIAAPGVKLLETKCKLPRGFAILVTAVVVVVGMGLTALLIVGSIKEAVGNLSTYQESLLKLADDASHIAQRFGVDPRHLGRDEIVAHIKDLPVISYFQSAAGKIISTFSDLVLIILLVVFLLTGQSFRFPPSITIRTIEANIRRYLVTKVVVSGATGVLTAVLLAILGVDMAVMFGFLAFVLNFIPTVGSLVATVLPLPIAIIQFGLGWQTVLAIALPGIVQFLIGNVLEPKLMGDSLDLHPVAILVALLFWGLIWGIPGMILATPILVIGKIILNRTSGGAFFAELMAGRIAYKESE